MFQNIVVPLDESAYSERALAHAEELSKLTGAAISLVTVCTHVGPAEVPEVKQLDDIAMRRAQLYLDKRAAAVRGDGVADVRTEARFGEPADVIATYARDEGADLIVMSTHGLGASRRYALGSVAMKVLTTAPCPVFMVRIREETSR
jgi:nucleotide-binding universal stress UspA family protein